MRSVYIHIPFCNTICSYCDFAKVLYKKHIVDKYLEQLDKEIKAYYLKDKIKTLYIGGGTPSFLSIEQLKKLFKIIKQFNLNECLEFSFECNIEDLTLEKLIILKENGVNRLSIGIETINKHLLKKLNRNYNINIKETIFKAKALGFNNINVDLIYAIPTQKYKDLINDLKFICSLNIEHISFYSLIIEKNTLFYINKVKPISDTLDYKMYNIIINTLKKHQYNHYEISNASKVGYESKHNLTYWNNEEYYGFGLGSHGYINNIRYENTRSIDKYLKGKYKYKHHHLTKKQTMENHMILGLRKIEGINKKQFKNKYNIDIKDIFNTNKLIETNDNFLIPYDKIYISNEILIDFIGDDYD